MPNDQWVNEDVSEVSNEHLEEMIIAAEQRVGQLSDALREVAYSRLTNHIEEDAHT